MQSQSGSAHVIIIGVLLVALVGALGVLFWQNVINKPADDTKTVASSTSESTADVAKKTYCAPAEKLCFQYPEDWTVTQNTSSNTTSADNLLITSPDQQVVLHFISGLGGMGSCCGPMAEGPVTIVNAQKIDGLALARSAYASERADGAYVSTIVTSDVTAEFSDPTDPATIKSTINGYVPQVVLHNAKKLMTAQTFTGVMGGLSLDHIMQGKNASMDVSGPSNPGSFLFGTLDESVEVKQKSYKTVDEAKNQLGSKSFIAARDILLSAYYQ